MKKHSYIYWLFIVFWLMMNQASAQEKILHVFVTDSNKTAVSGISITCTQSCSTELVSQGRAKIALPIQTRPNDIIILRLVRRSPDNPEWIIISPPNGELIVPAFTSQGVMFIPVMVTIKGDKQTLLNEKGVRTIVENALKKSQMLDGQVSSREYEISLNMQAKTFGLTQEEVTNAILEWKVKAKDPYDQGLSALIDKKYSEATKLLTKSYEIRKKSLEGFLDTAYFLGTSLWEEGKYKESVEKLQEVVVFRKNDPTVFNQLGLSLTYAGNLSEAETIYKRSLTIAEREFGKENQLTAVILNNIGVLYRSQYKYAEAEKYYNDALAINRKILGNEHPLTANSLNNMGMLFISQNKYIDAERLLKEALAIREKKLGKDHPDTAITMDNLGNLYSTQGRYEEAEPLLKYALNVKEKTLGYEHPITANSYENLGDLYSRQGKYDKAEPLLKYALNIKEKTLGEQPITADSYETLGYLYSRQGKYDKAEPLLKYALSIKEKTLGYEHPITANSYWHLGQFYFSQGKNADAVPFYEKAINIREKQGLNTSTVHNDLGAAYYRLNKYAEAERSYKKAIDICTEKLPNKCAMTFRNLGKLYFTQGKYIEAEPLFQRAITIFEKGLDVEIPARIVLVLEIYAELLRKTDREAEAVVMETRAKEIRAKTGFNEK
jgi:tetratricopeptide (TPR) repeat protein